VPYDDIGNELRKLACTSFERVKPLHRTTSGEYT